MWFGVGIAVVLCPASASASTSSASELPQKQQEGLETIVGLIAVAAVTYMIVWMRRHARGIKGTSRARPPAPWPPARPMALVGMAFLAVLREGFETSVFLLAAFQDRPTPPRPAPAPCSAWSGGRDRRRPLPRRRPHQPDKFFRITGLVLVLVAAGLLATAAPHRPRGGLDQQLPGPGARPDLAGPAGHDPRLAADRDAGPAAEPDPDRGAVYLAYAVPMVLYVLWPRQPAPRRASTSAAPRRQAHGPDPGLTPAARR